ncbi:MAG: TlpA disulfide reductase family protein [Mariprofundus sp.]|nr:TlpA disulfide reductase family protein [Mariprofundus sp.]
MNQERSMAIRWITVLSVFVGIGAVIWFSLPEAPASVRQGDYLTEFTLPDVNGVMQTAPKGEVLLLNFWATWCPPCRREIPSMARLHDKYASQGLKIVAISVDQRRDDLVDFMKEYRMPFQVLHDADGAVSRQYGVFRYPESFLIDRNGKVIRHLIGAVDWMSEPIMHTIDGMLGESAKDTGEVNRGERKAAQG